jgi:hypothetical protein
MKKQILYVTAFNENGMLVKANDAEKAEKYYCPICKNELILKKSGNTGKGSKRPHFAHYALTENCTPESVLHYSFKKMLLDKIRDYINKKIPMNMIWKCDYCHTKHEGNLLKMVFDVKDEFDMKICRPDIALFNGKGDVFAVIEIVVTHKPEDNAIKHYKKNKIILIQIELDSENDLERIDEKLEKPSIVDFCYNPRCQICGTYKAKKELIILNNTCYKCGKPMKICYISINNGNNGFIYPSGFDENEINFAKAQGVTLEMRFSKTANEKYLANICPNCRAFIGDWFLFDDYILENMYEKNIPKYNMGYYCEECKKINM